MTHAAVQLWFAKWGLCRGSRAEEGCYRRNNQQRNHFQLCSWTAWLACSQVAPERVGSPILLSSLSSVLFLPNPYTHSLQLCKATGEKKEERRGEGNFWNNTKRRQQETSKDVKRVGAADGSLGYAGEVIFFPFRRKQRGLRAFFRRMRRQNLPRLTKQAFLSWSWNHPACDLMSPGLCGGQWRMPGCPLWSPICLSSGWASTGWCGARSAPPHGSASKWSSLLSSASGSASRVSVRIPASRATTPRWSRRTGRGLIRSSGRASGSVSGCWNNAGFIHEGI